MEDKEASAECRKTNATQAGYRKRVMRRINEDSHTQEPVARRRNDTKPRTFNDSVLLIKFVEKVQKLVKSR
ncbi:unnamed protein product [Brugia timori]|uniref:Uncharacterized protein n=1 Tax=Brugia timori TaxID=42155 RepID=A0A0R3QXL6_9BILA|nr:unnamed protein product [Brugia timori]